MHKNQIPILQIVTGGMERIDLPPLIRPPVPNDNPNEALVLWGTTYYTYCVIAHVRVILRGMVELLGLENVPTAFLACRHVFEWTAHSCLMSREMEGFIGKKNWKGANELQSRVMGANRWVKEHGEKYEPGYDYDEIPDSMRVKKALKAYEQYQQQQHGISDVEDSYALLSEHTHPNSACFNSYTQIIGREVRFVRPSTDSALLGEERCLIDLVLFLDTLLRLGKETNVHRQLRSVIDELLEANKKRDNGDS
ncbi:MAG: hypothetical protein ABSB87_00565 [Terriglobales bacterium]